LNLGNVQVTDSLRQDLRPSRSNRGQGGAIAQLQAVSDRLHVQHVKKPANNALQDVPINKMAPPEKGRRNLKVVFYFILHLFALMHQYQAKAAGHPRPAKPDPPLNLTIAKPTFTTAKNDSAFGFKSRAPPDEVFDSDVDMEEGSVKSAAERLAEEISRHSNDESESHSFSLYLISLPIKYLLLGDYDNILYGSGNGLSQFIYLILIG
jgi:hypothetical protein